MDVLGVKKGKIFADVKFEPGSGIKIGEIKNKLRCIYPLQVVDDFTVKMAAMSKSTVVKSLKDVELFNVYCHETDDFLGSMYAIVEDGEYFSVFVGETDVFVFTDDSFEFVKSDSLYIPVKNEEDTMYYLICNFVKGSNDVEPRSLVKRNGCKEEVLLSFTKKAIVVDALQRCYSLLNL